MLGWLARRIGLGRPDRYIFRFYDGDKYRYADPVVIDSKLRTACPDLDKLIVFLELPDETMPGGVPANMLALAKTARDKAVDKLAAGVRTAFGVRELADDGSGLTVAECINLLADFTQFANTVAEETRPLALSQPPTGSSPAAATTPAPSADSTSTANSPSPPSPSEPEPAAEPADYRHAFYGPPPATEPDHHFVGA